jgi:plastocyanin
MPDWNGLVALIPIAIAGVVALSLIWLLRTWSRAGPTRRGPGPVPPSPPAGVHMPGPSFAPVFAAVGAVLLFAGLVLGGWVAVLGLAALVVTLLYWLREGMRDYEHLEPSRETLPAIIHAGPPEGVHMPGPSYRPLLVALALFVLFAGLVIGGWVLLAGVVVVAWALLGWLRDARREFLLTLQADRTGHLDPLPDPHFPTGSVAISGLIVALALAVNAGLIPPTETASGGEGSPGPSGGPGGSPSASAGPSAGPTVPAADVTIEARGIQYLQREVSVPAGPFTIAFLNSDAGIPHDIDIFDAGGSRVFDGEVITGVSVIVYDVPAQPAGSYPFVCSIHANMTGTLTLQ